jgi:micrococcal nuclease
MRRARYGVLVGLAASLVAALAGCEELGTARYEPGERVDVRVERVVDGDTAVVSIDGRSEYVRYIGIDTPESVKPDTEPECFSYRASNENRRLVEGRSVELEFDRELYDRYDRLLAYVRLDGQLVNEELLRKGLATTLTIPPNDRYADEFSALEDEARNSGMGIWGAC